MHFFYFSNLSFLIDEFEVRSACEMSQSLPQVYDNTFLLEAEMVFYLVEDIQKVYFLPWR